MSSTLFAVKIKNNIDYRDINNITLFGNKRYAGFVFTIFSSEYLNEHVTFQVFLIFLLFLTLFLIPTISLLFWNSLTTEPEKNGFLFKFSCFFEKSNNWKILVPLCFFYNYFFNDQNKWSYFFAKLSFILTVFGIISRAIILQHLTLFYDIPYFLLQITLYLYPIVLLNQVFTLTISLSILIYEKIFIINPKLKLMVFSHFIIRGILKDDEDIHTEYSDNFQKKYNNYPLPKTPIRPFWAKLRGNAATVGIGIGLLSAGFAGTAALNSWNANKLAENANKLLEKQIDQKDVELGVMPRDVYVNKYKKNK